VSRDAQILRCRSAPVILVSAIVRLALSDGPRLRQLFVASVIGVATRQSPAGAAIFAQSVRL
jgi:hypothetical protein